MLTSNSKSLLSCIDNNLQVFVGPMVLAKSVNSNSLRFEDSYIVIKKWGVKL